jgi:hypothetical protein
VRGVGAPVQNYFPELSLRECPAAEARAVLGDAAFEEAHAEGRAMNFEQAVEDALADNVASSE